MADLLNTMKEIVAFVLEIKSTLDKAKQNVEDCRMMDNLLLSLSAIADRLKGSPKIMEDDLMRATTEGLRKALQPASEFVAKCKAKGTLYRAFNAKYIAEKLSGICRNVLLTMGAVQLNMGAVQLANGAKLEENMAQLCTNVSRNSSELAELTEIVAKILQTLATQPAVHPPQEVEKLVEDDQISPQIKNKNKGKAKETDVARTEVKNQKKNKKLGRSTAVPDASLRNGLPESTSADSMGEKGSSTIVAARPDVDLPEEVEKLVKDGQINSQIKNKGKAKETAAATSQDKNKGEADKTVVARPEDKIEKKKKKLRRSTVVPHASLQDDLAESASATSVIGQDDGPSTISINKASSSISKSVDEAQLVGVSAAPFHPQKIISISKERGETGGYKICTCSSETSKLLEVYPQRLLFPLEPKNKETTGSGCPVTLTNRTNCYVGICIKQINGKFKETEIMEPCSTLVVYATMEMHAQPPEDTVKFEVLMIIVRSKRDREKLKSFIVDKLNMDSGFMVRVKNLKAEVYRAMLTAITCDPASCQIISRSIVDTTLVTSIDAHPTKPWIVTGHKGGSFSIWDYQKRENVMEVPDKGACQRPAFFQYIKETSVQHSVFSVKFTAEGKRLVVGDGRGYIYVYDSTDTKLHEVEKFRAYDKKSVNSLAAHPTKPYLLLSSSSFSRNIKLWDSSENWKFQNFKVKPENTYYVGVHSVKFNPNDTNTFACVTDEDRVKVWNIKTSILETTLKGPFVMADYFFNRGHQHLMVTLKFDAHNSEIWDLKTRKVGHTLSVSGHKTTWVACHPKLPILVTMLDDGTVCLWDASTYRLEKMVHITDSKCRDLVFVPDTNGPPRLAIAFETMIAIMEVNSPIANTSNASGLIMGTN